MRGTLREALEAGDWIEGPLRDEYDRCILECALKVQRYNTTAMASVEEMHDALEDIIGSPVDSTSLAVFPFRCDLGFNIRLGRDVFVNYGCEFIDTAPIAIGDHTKIGPGCHLVAADHPRDHLERRTHKVRGLPVTIGSDCWLGANVTVVPGVSIGDRCIIGAGSVVTRDVPSDSVFAGNPARAIHRFGSGLFSVNNR
jgi:maltose O-acetyltransferase